MNKNYEINDTPPKLVTSALPGPILHMEYFHYVQESNLSRENIMRVVFVLTPQFLYYFTGSRDFEMLFSKYIGKDPVTVKYSVISLVE